MPRIGRHGMLCLWHGLRLVNDGKPGNELQVEMVKTTTTTGEGERKKELLRIKKKNIRCFKREMMFLEILSCGDLD